MEEQDKNIDFDTMQEMKYLMNGKFSLMIHQYFESANKYLHKIEEGILSNNAIQIAEAAHPLKSSSASLGCIGFSELTKEIEYKALDLADNGGDTQSLLLLYNDIIQSFDHVKAVLEAELIPA